MLDTPIREQVRALLDVLEGAAVPPPPDVCEKLSALIKEAYAGAPADVWEEVSARFRKVTGRGEAPAQAAPEREPLESIVSDGWFADYLDWTRESEAPTSFHFGAALACASIAFGRRPRFLWGGGRLYPNLYVFLVGPSGETKKGGAIGPATSLFAKGTNLHTLGQVGTPQGYAAALRRRYETTHEWADALIVAPEFSGMARAGDPHVGPLVQWLTDWYDGGDANGRWARELRGEEGFVVQNPYVGLLAGTNMEWFRLMPRDIATGGFLVRGLLIEEATRRHWRSDPQYDKRIEGRLLSRLQTIRYNPPPQVVSFSGEVREAMRYWYEVRLRSQSEATDDDALKKWISRKQATAIKVAYIWQMMDLGPRDVIALPWFEKATRFVDWCDTSVQSVYRQLGTTTEGEAAADVLAFVKRRGGEASERQMLRALKNKYVAQRIREALRLLKAAGELVDEQDPAKGHVWRAV